jgi:pimeloyl-ACP methyl ester carboxylesterase
MTNISTTFVSTATPAQRSVIGESPCKGLFWAPEERDHPPIAFLMTHYDEDLSEHYLAPLLAERGFGVLGWNTRYRSQAHHFDLKNALNDISAAVQWLRTNGAATVILLGTSGGGSLSVIYQAEAEASRAASDPALVPADGLITMNAHLGRPEWLTSMLDPSVTDELDPLSTDDSLDLFRQSVPLAPTFVEKYRRAQIARNRRISEWVVEELARLSAAGDRDRLFVVHRVWADPRYVDMTLEPTDRAPGCFFGNAARANHGVHGPARLCTLRSWQTMWDIDRSICTATTALQRVHVPSFVLQGLADQGVFPSDAAALHDGLAAADKVLHLVPGDHFLLSPPDARERCVDRIVDWTCARWAEATTTRTSA